MRAGCSPNEANLDGVRSSIGGLGIPGRKPHVEWDFKALSTAPRDLSRGAVVRGDIRFELHAKDKRILRFWVHSAFIEGGVLRLTKAELDGPHKDRKCKKFDDAFTVTVTLDTVGTVDTATSGAG